jgi:dihydrofolate synthase/folylpolyglutamate synthase
LGGRLDATNATDPLISVITRIGYDHTNLLGRTLSQITNEKAEIIRDNSKLITIHQKPDVEKILKRVARDRGSTIVFADEQHEFTVTDQSLKGSHIRISGRIGDMDIFLPIVGNHQVENLSLALAVLFELKTMGYYIDLNAMKAGIERTDLKGRFDVISENPLVIFDCAHNEDSFQALDNNLQAFNISNFCLIFGANEDKDISYCLKHIFPRAKIVYLVKSDSPRAREPEELMKMARKFQNRLCISGSVQEAIRTAAQQAAPDNAVVITGSFYLWQKDWNIP